jgi:tumor protein p53-inducible protein 3
MCVLRLLSRLSRIRAAPLSSAQFRVCPLQAAGSGVGLAACQLLRAHGAIPIATARTADKLVAAAEYGAALTINTAAVEDWVAVLKDFTAGRGADVILDPDGGAYSAANANAIGLDGRWVVYGLMGGVNLQAEGAMRTLLMKRAAIIGTTLRSRTLEYKGELCSALQQHAFPKFESQEFKPVVDKVFPLAEAAAAHTLMEANSNTGKIVLRVIA